MRSSRRPSPDAYLSSRIEAKERSDAAKRSGERRELVDRWLQARRDGLTAEAAAKAVGKPRSTLSRWARELTPKSTRPHKVRKPKADPKLAIAVERLRKENPMWGKDTLTPLLWDEGFDCSVSMVGRILKKLVERGVVDAERHVAGMCGCPLRLDVEHHGVLVGIRMEPAGALDAEELLHLALQAMEQNRDEDAISCLKRAIALEPENPHYRNNLGKVVAKGRGRPRATA